MGDVIPVLCAFVGAFGLYMHGRPNTELFDSVFPSWNRSVSKDVAALLVFVVLGGVIGLIVTSPDTARQGLAAGLGWSAVINTGGPYIISRIRKDE